MHGSQQKIVHKVLLTNHLTTMQRFTPKTRTK